MFDTEIILSLKNADILFIENFFSKKEADTLFKELLENIAWQQGEISMFGKKVLEPRLTAWYGDAGKTYKYSGKTNIPLAWNAPLLAIKSKIEEEVTPSRLSRDVPSVFRAIFNSVLLNLYRNGNDSMGFHSDNEPELGKNPTIASVNFGESRRFIFKRKDNNLEKHELLLTHGSLLIMAGEMQHYWLHGVPKEPKKTNERINLTFRKL
jgi:alkylated DNA repair dioxygenase AlkB